VSTVRSQMLSNGDIRDWEAVIDQVPRCFVLKTPLKRHCEFVLHLLRNTNRSKARFDLTVCTVHCVLLVTKAACDLSMKDISDI